MINEKYWRSSGNIINRSILDSDIPDSVGDRLILARDLFQSGIVLIMNGDETEARKFLARACQIFVKQETTLGYRDLMRLHIADWILFEKKESPRYLTKASVSLEQEIYQDVMKAGVLEIFEILQYQQFRGFTEKSSEIAQHFPFAADDKYPYERIADQLTLLSRIQLLLGRLAEARKLIKSAQQLFSLALRKIPVMMMRDYPQWNRYLDLSDNELTDPINRDAQQILEIRRQIRGHIPLFQQQTEILMFLAGTKDNISSSVLAASYEKIEQFFRTVVNPPGKKESVLGLVDELELVLLRAMYHHRMTSKQMPQSRSEILRHFMG